MSDEGNVYEIVQRQIAEVATIREDAVFAFGREAESWSHEERRKRLAALSPFYAETSGHSPRG